MSRPAPVKPVTIIVDGVTHEGSYFLQDLTLHIRSPPRSDGYPSRQLVTRSHRQAAAV